MAQKPYSRYFTQKIANDAGGQDYRTFGVAIHLTALQAVASSADGVIAAFACSDAKTTKTAGLTSPVYPRNITATAAAETANNIKNVKVTITGTNAAGAVITEELPAFSDNTPGLVAGNKAFATVTKVEVPAMDGACTVAIGWGDKLGIGYKLAHNTVSATFVNNVLEATAATVAVSATDLESNTLLAATSLSGKVVDIYLTVTAQPK